MKAETTEKRTLKNIEFKVAEKLHKKLMKDLQKANDKFMLDYDMNAHGEFCADVIVMIDIMLGQVVEKSKGKHRGV